MSPEHTLQQNKGAQARALPPARMHLAVSVTHSHPPPGPHQELVAGLAGQAQHLGLRREAVVLEVCVADAARRGQHTHQAQATVAQQHAARGLDARLRGKGVAAGSAMLVAGARKLPLLPTRLPAAAAGAHGRMHGSTPRMHVPSTCHRAAPFRRRESTGSGRLLRRPRRRRG